MKSLQGRACRLYPGTTIDPCKLTSAGERHDQIWVLEKLLIACEEWTMFSTEIKIPLETWIEFPAPGFGQGSEPEFSLPLPTSLPQKEKEIDSDRKLKSVPQGCVDLWWKTYLTLDFKTGSVPSFVPQETDITSDAISPPTNGDNLKGFLYKGCTICIEQSAHSPI